MARRGVYEPVYCWLPDYATVCCRHRRWIGAGTSTLDDQRDLRCAPAVIAAAQRHARLDRCHGDAARFAVRDAARIHRCWARSTSPFTLPPARADADTHIGAYPDLIALAAILAGAHRRIWGTAPATPARARAVDAVYVNVSARFPSTATKPAPSNSGSTINNSAPPAAHTTSTRGNHDQVNPRDHRARLGQLGGVRADGGVWSHGTIQPLLTYQYRLYCLVHADV